MVIKKPYGFLIKHYKLIHLLLIIPTLYLLFKFSDISTFFTQYVAKDYKTFEVTVAGSYITLLTYLALIFMMISNGIIYLLMSSKKKPTFIYATGLIYTIVLFALTIVFYSTLDSIETKTLDLTIINFVVSMAKAAPYPSYFLLVAYFIKGIGFNIKTMRFENNTDLYVSEEDEEEIEIKINSDGYTTKKTIIHTLRELKYYVLENKFVFTCFAVVGVIGIGIALYMNFEVYNKKYKLYQAFVLDNFTMTLKESYITNVDYSGNLISEDKYFVALKIAIFNKSYQDMNIDSSNFRLYYGNKFKYPSYERSSRFIDIGKNYQGTVIKKQSSADFVFVYELTEEELRTQYQIKILSSLTKDANTLTPAYKIINIRPVNILKQENIGESKIGKEVLLKETMLGDSIYKINSVSFQSSYVFKSTQCVGVDKCSAGNYTVVASGGKTLMVVKDSMKWDETTSYYINSKRDYYGDFAKLKFNYKSIIYDKTYTSDLVDVTPSHLKGYKVYEVSQMLESATNIDLIFTIRNKTVTIHLK